MTLNLPSTQGAKAQAKQLRTTLAATGTVISHTQSLERIAQQHGFRDWNTFITATTGNGFAERQRVKGWYLSQPFTATVIRAESIQSGWTYLDLGLDEAIDTVTSASFTNLRKRIRGVVGPKGWSRERTSNGSAHLQIDMSGKIDE